MAEGGGRQVPPADHAALRRFIAGGESCHLVHRWSRESDCTRTVRRAQALGYPDRTPNPRRGFSGLLIRRSLVRAQVEEPRQASRKANPRGLAFLLSGRLLVRGFRCRARDHAYRRGRSVALAQCAVRGAPAARHATNPVPQPLRRDGPLPTACPRRPPRFRRGAAPGYTASSTPPPTTRPAQTGPRADFGQPIVLVSISARGSM